MDNGLQNRVTVLKFRGAAVAVPRTLKGPLLKRPKMAQNALCCHPAGDWSDFGGWSGNATVAATACPSPPSGESLRARGEAKCCDPTTACLSLPCLALLAAFEAGCPAAAAGHRPCRYGEGGSAGWRKAMFSCRKERQALLPAAVPVLRDHAHLLFFHLFT